MLKKFEVSGYRNFKERFLLDFSDIRDYQFNKQCIKDNLLNNIIIYGKNAVGKTNFGGALFDIKSNFQRELLSAENEDESYLNADTDRRYAEFKYLFIFDGIELQYEYRKKKLNNLLYEKLLIDNKIIFEFNHEDKEKVTDNMDIINADTLNWEFVDNEISIISYVINNIPLNYNEVMSKFYRFIKGMQFIRGNNSRFQSFMCRKLVAKILDNNLLNNFQEFLNRFGVQEELVEVNLPTGEKMLCFKHVKPIPFIENCSSGTNSLVQLYNWYINIDDVSFLYMDEFDAFYHYELSEKVVNLFGEIRNCQTISTSHNTNLLSNKIMRPDCFFILTKEKLSSIVNATSRELREGHNLEKLYMSGEFGE
jgi:AAA15 family ATPase/GTPase